MALPDLLPFYAILRSIPNKLLGVIAMFSAILILLVMPFADLSRSRGITFKPLSKAAFFLFLANFLVLLTLGAKHVESPFIEFGQISTVLYFAHFLIIVPSISLLENSLVELASPTRERSGVKHESAEGMVHATVISGYSSYLPYITHKYLSHKTLHASQEVNQVNYMPIRIDLDTDDNVCPFPGPGEELVYVGGKNGRPGENIILPAPNGINGIRVEPIEPEVKPSGPTDKPNFHALRSKQPLVKLNKGFNYYAKRVPFFITTPLGVSLIGIGSAMLASCVYLGVDLPLTAITVSYCDAPRP